MSKTAFFCTECGYEAAKWMGRCPACQAWNTFAEEPKAAGGKARSTKVSHSACSINEIPDNDTTRILSGIQEFDNVIGGGIVPGSAILIGGEPGIGKSTLLLQIADHTAKRMPDATVLYISAEENSGQIKLRAVRTGADCPRIYILSAGSLNAILENTRKIKPLLLIVDSIQAVYSDELSASSPGTVSQVRECSARLIEHCKETSTAIILSGHVTKEGSLAGPKMLEHMVDTVLYFEGLRDQELRILRSVKNRFGTINEIAVFYMKNTGLEEILDPSGIFFNSGQSSGPGSCLTAALEGNRVIIAELQALVTDKMHNSISRTIDGVEPNRVLRIKALLNQHFGLNLIDKDIFINVTAGLEIYEPAVDLAIAIAITESFREKQTVSNAVFLGEISLLGDLRRITQPVSRIQQAKKLGIAALMLPEANRADCKDITGIQLIFARDLAQALAAAF
jgi:DNA repair protein RadA/Sms